MKQFNLPNKEEWIVTVFDSAVQTMMYYEQEVHCRQNIDQLMLLLLLTTMTCYCSDSQSLTLPNLNSSQYIVNITTFT